MNIDTDRLVLQRIDPELAQRIVARDERPGDRWHPEYPFADELDPLRNLAASRSAHPVFTMYAIRRRTDGLAIGGFGFFGAPDDSGRIEFGYGLVPSARGCGLGTEAVRAALEFAQNHGAHVAVADTHITKLASQRVLEKADMVETHRDDTFVYFSKALQQAAASYGR
jgi:RimJ/RimL family protein N-acetyltransferase